MAAHPLLAGLARMREACAPEKDDDSLQWRS
jgi:hypothetical protein